MLSEKWQIAKHRPNDRHCCSFLLQVGRFGLAHPVNLANLSIEDNTPFVRGVVYICDVFRKQGCLFMADGAFESDVFSQEAACAQ